MSNEWNINLHPLNTRKLMNKSTINNTANVCRDIHIWNNINIHLHLFSDLTKIVLTVILGKIPSYTCSHYSSGTVTKTNILNLIYYLNIAPNSMLDIDRLLNHTWASSGLSFTDKIQFQSMLKRYLGYVNVISYECMWVLWKFYRLSALSRNICTQE